MSPGNRDPYLSAGDAALLPRGFKRRKSSEFEWIRREGDDRLWIHLNFGLAVINPTYGVAYEDLGSILSPEAGARHSVAEILSSTSGRSYSLKTPSETVASDIETYALPALDQLRDRDAVAARLASPLAGSWPTFSSSDRIRLYPLLLASLGRVEEALARVSEFEASAATFDQLIPEFATYARYFRARYRV